MPAPQGHPHPSTAALGAGASAPTPPTIAQIVEGIFTRFDADSSASITLAELSSVLDPSGSQAEATTQASAVLAQLDSDSNSVLSKAEISAAVAQLDADGDGSLSRADRGSATTLVAPSDALRLLMHDPAQREARPAPAPKTIGETVDALFSRFDDDADDSITLTELLAGLDSDGRHGGLTSAIEEWVKQADINADGSLSVSELTGSVTEFDSNASGTLEPADFHPHDQGGMPEIALLGLLMHGLDLPPDHGA